MLEHSHQKDLFTLEDLKVLAKFKGSPCVSIYLPTFKSGKKRQENLIRFDNALKTAATHLENLKADSQLINSILGPAKKLKTDSAFWKLAGDGVALFGAPGFFETWRIPYRFGESVVVSDVFSLKPLLPYLSDDGKFFLLCVDKKKVQLFECSRYGMRQVREPSLPLGIADSLPNKDFDRRLQSHSGGSSKSAELVHGQGGLTDAEKNLVNRYFRRIDAAVCVALAGEKAPLIFAGGQNLFPLYRNANNYQLLLKTGVWGNPFIVNEESLHQQAWQIAQNYLSAPKKSAFAKIRDLKGTSLLSIVPEVIVTAAYAGKVDLLITAAQASLWGIYDPATGSYQEHTKQNAGDQDLLGKAALDTFLHRGSVYFVSPEEMPGKSQICAVLRQ